MSSTRRYSSALSAPLALLLLFGAALPGAASTRTKISDAQKRLSALESQIASEEGRVDVMQIALKAMALHVEESNFMVDAIQRELRQTQRARATAEAEFASMSEQIRSSATATYIEGPAYSLQALIDLKSMSDAADVIAYSSVITRNYIQLAAEAHRTALQLKTRQRRETELMARRNDALARLSSQQAALAKQFAGEQVHLSRLALARHEVGTLLAHLRAQLRAEEIAAAEAALARGTPIAFGQWAQAFLTHIRAPVDRNNLVVMVAWETAEYTAARWNPLATTYPMHGSTIYNSSGVRNYASLAQGLQATLQTLQQPGLGYEPILADLRSNADSMTTARAINASRWCSGCADGRYVVDLIPVVQRYYDSYARQRA